MVLQAHGGFGPGFDLLRLLLAVSVVAWHSQLAAHGSLAPLLATPLWSSEFFVVPSFFVISGFVVSASAERLPARAFLLNRCARIIPAHASTLLICALLLGPLVTGQKLPQYLFGGGFAAYLVSMTGVVHHHLADGSGNTPHILLNPSLWSIQYEIVCYLLMAGLRLSGLLRAPGKLLLATLGVLVLAEFAHLAGLRHAASPVVRHFANVMLLNGNAKVFDCFLTGVVLYQWRARIPFDPRLLMAALAVCGTIAILGGPELNEAPWIRFISLPAMGYAVVYLGLCQVPRPQSDRRRDYSYGISLVHFPLLQTVVFLVPGISAPAALAIALPAVVGAAAASWHLVERPVLTWRKRFAIAALPAAT